MRAMSDKQIKIFQVFAVCWFVTVILLLFGRDRQVSKLKQEKEDLSAQLAHAMIEPSIIRDTIHDSIPVGTAPVVAMEPRTYRKVTDKKLLKDLKVKPNQVSAEQKTSTVIHDTVPIVAHQRDKLEFHDHWTDFVVDMKPPDTTLTYSVRDSVTTIVYREYKHHFLWWHWGTKGYKVKIVNFNPHAKLLYNQFVKVEK